MLLNVLLFVPLGALAVVLTRAAVVVGDALAAALASSA